MADITISLNMKKRTGNGIFPPSGFQPCQNNANYAYKYSGGNYDNGKGFRFTVPPTTSPPSPPAAPKTVVVNLIGSGNTNYEVSSAEVHYDVSPPAHADVTESAVGSTVTITDTDLDVETGTFKVFVNDTTNTVNGIECDPRWQNK